jgi:hypothetical protein
MIPTHFDEAALFFSKESSEIPKMTCEVALVYNNLDTRRTPSSFVFVSNECHYILDRFAVAVYASNVSQLPVNCFFFFFFSSSSSSFFFFFFFFSTVPTRSWPAPQFYIRMCY